MKKRLHFLPIHAMMTLQLMNFPAESKNMPLCSWHQVPWQGWPCFPDMYIIHPCRNGLVCQDLIVNAEHPSNIQSPVSQSTIFQNHCDINLSTMNFKISNHKDLLQLCCIQQDYICLLNSSDDFFAKLLSRDWVATNFSCIKTLYSYKCIRFFCTSAMSISAPALNSVSWN